MPGISKERRNMVNLPKESSTDVAVMDNGGMRRCTSDVHVPTTLDQLSQANNSSSSWLSDTSAPSTLASKLSSATLARARQAQPISYNPMTTVGQWTGGRKLPSYTSAYSDSGFGSSFSAGSSVPGSSNLPPPPPYRMSYPARAQRIHRSLSDSRYAGPSMAAPIVHRTGSLGVSRSPSPSMSSVSCPEQYHDLTDKLHRLENDKDSLSLQVNILSEQVNAQTEKIKDLESTLDTNKIKLDDTEDLLQEEMVTRCTLETSKLDLMGQISRLKLHCAAMDREKSEIETRLMGAQSEIDQVQQNITDLPAMSRSTYARPPLPNIHQYHRPSILNPGGEIESLRAAVQQLIMTNDYNNATSHPLAYTSNDPPKVSIYNQQGNALHQVSTTTPVDNQDEDINVRIRQLLNIPVGVGIASDNPHGSLSSHSVTSYLSSSPTNYSTPPSLHSPWSTEYKPPPFSYSTPTYKPVGTNPLHPNDMTSPAQQLAAELDLIAQRYPMSHQLTPSGSMPRNFSAMNNTVRRKKSSSGSNHNLVSNEPQPQKKASTPLKGLKWLSQTLRRSKRSTSAPNLAFTEDELLTSTKRAWDDEIYGKEKEKKNRFMSLISNKFQHRSPTQSSVGHSSFNRSANSRASLSGASIGSYLLNSTASTSYPLPMRPPVEMFAGWNNIQCREWLVLIGLEMYDVTASRVIQSGRHLLSMTLTHMQKELQIHHPLHRKKLHLALRAVETNSHEPQESMDYHQVLRWLDDIGLPQYRDVFADARIDGQVLNLLTVDDLLYMKVNQAIHHSSLAKGIQLLRLVAFNLNRLERKLDLQSLHESSNPWKVQMWSQHCISQWLQLIDLTEYSPNLMCAGIHGALMVLEPTFTAETLAEILQIPCGKTLLRRHLCTHFNTLLGQDIIINKRQALQQPFATQLNTKMTVKSAKKSFSSHGRKVGQDIYRQPTDFICPFRFIPPSSHQNYQSNEHISESVLKRLPASNV